MNSFGSELATRISRDEIRDRENLTDKSREFESVSGRGLQDHAT
jgi:hypothetical protein